MKFPSIKLLKLFLFLAFLTSSILGCTQKPEEKPADYFPLKPGNFWEYEGEGNEFASFKREVLYVKNERAQIQENNGGTISTAIFETTDNAVTRIFFEGENYDQTNMLDRQPNDNTVILKTPLKVGTKWGENDNQREIVATDVTVETPAGTFKNCIKVKITGQYSTVYEYFKKGVGMVKRETDLGEEKITSTLKKYEVKKE